MTSPQPVTFELESFGHIEAMIEDAHIVSRTIVFPQARFEPSAAQPTDLTISDGCIALTEGMALYGS
jgi:hypothetical protein